MESNRWIPYFSLDLLEQGLLPEGWDEAALALAGSPDRHRIMTGPDESPWTFEIVEGDRVREHLGWLWPLYHGTLREFAAGSVDYPLFVSNRLRATATLNILSGANASNDWHTDMNAVTAVLFANTPDHGGDLIFRDAAGREARIVPRPGLFVCFEGAVEHKVTPLSAGSRLSLAMLYYRSATDQPPAYDIDVYERPGTHPL